MITRHVVQKVNCRASFTLVELMVVLAIISILSSALLFALFSVTEDAKAARTRSQIAKLHELVIFKYQSYRTRAIRINIPPYVTNDATILAAARLIALRDLMRMELPDRKTDVLDGPVAIVVPGVGTSTFSTSLAAPAAWRNFRKRAGLPRWPLPGSAAAWTTDYEGAECLYMIVASIRDGEASGLDFFKESEIGDTDADGLPEIVDGWGNPIMFFRWAPGFATLPGPDGAWGVVNTDDNSNGVIDELAEIGWPGSDDATEMQSRDVAASPDPFDPLQVDGQNYALIPLIYSAGPDGVYDLSNAIPFRYVTTGPTPNNPFFRVSTPVGLIGRPTNIGGDPTEFNSLDNITNHLIVAD